MSHDSDDVTLFLRGAALGLGPLRRELTPVYQRWMNDLRVTRTLSAPLRPVSFEAEAAWVAGALVSDEPVFTIYELATMRAIGNTGFHNVDLEHGIAEYGLLIGETDVWGRGYATAVTRLMLEYAFDVLGLYNVRLSVFAHNPAGIRAYERAGFKRIGARRGAFKVGRRRYDEIYMDAIADDFEPSGLDAMMHMLPDLGRETGQTVTVAGSSTEESVAPVADAASQAGSSNGSTA